MFRPGDNTALDCGKSGIVVIDLDVKNGKDGVARWAELKTRHGIDDSQALRTLTGGGKGARHLIFRDTTSGAIGNSDSKLVGGVDVKARGGCVLLPGSVHPETGKPYLPIGDWGRQPGPLPDKLRDLLLASKAKPAPRPTPAPTPRPGNGNGHEMAAYAEAALDGELEILASTREGARNHQLNASAFALGQMVGAGWLAEAEVRAELREAALKNGLGEHEVEATLASGLAAGMSQPREEPDDRLPQRPEAPAQPAWQAPFDLPPPVKPPDRPDLTDVYAEIECIGERSNRLNSCGSYRWRVNMYTGKGEYVMWRCGIFRWCATCRKSKMDEIFGRLRAARLESDLSIGKLTMDEGTKLVRKLGKAQTFRIVLADDAHVLMVATEEFEGSRPLTGDDLTLPEAQAWCDRVIKEIPEDRHVSGSLGKPPAGETKAEDGEAPVGTIEVSYFSANGSEARVMAAFERARARTPMIPGPDLASVEAALYRLTEAWKEEARDDGMRVTHEFSRKEKCDFTRIDWGYIRVKSHGEPELSGVTPHEGERPAPF